MVERLKNIDARIFYASLMIIIVSAFFRHFPIQEIVSIVVTALIIVLALGNIVYLYGRFKRRGR